MRKGYERPLAELLLISCEDVMTLSPGLSVGGTGEAGGNVDFEDWLSNLTNGGQGSDEGGFGADDVPMS